VSGRRRVALERLGEFAATLPGTAEEFPWGVRVAKVNGKIFVFLGSAGENKDVISVKLPISSDAALARSCGRPTGYGLGKSHWVTIGLDDLDCPPLDLLCDWIEESYRAVAPGKLVADLDQDRHRIFGVRKPKGELAGSPKTTSTASGARQKSDRADRQANLPT